MTTSELRTRVQADLIQAMKDKSELKGMIVLVKSDLDEQAREASVAGAEVSEKDQQGIIRKHIKNAHELIAYAEKMNLTEKIEEENRKISYLESLLPQQLTEAELQAAVKAIVEKHEGENVGKLIGMAIKEIANSSSSDISSMVRKVVKGE